MNNQVEKNHQETSCSFLRVLFCVLFYFWQFERSDRCLCLAEGVDIQLSSDFCVLGLGLAVNYIEHQTQDLPGAQSRLLILPSEGLISKGARFVHFVLCACN